MHIYIYIYTYIYICTFNMYIMFEINAETFAKNNVYRIIDKEKSCS